MKLDNHCILHTDQKKVQNNSIKVWHYFKMESIFRISESHRFWLDLADNLNLKDPKKNMVLANLSIYYTWKNIKSKYNNNKCKISTPTCNDSFDLPNGSYSISDIQDYFQLINQKTWNLERESAYSNLSKQNQK